MVNTGRLSVHKLLSLMVKVCCPAPRPVKTELLGADGVHEYVRGEDPPDAVTEITPVKPPKQRTFV
jgi:hypothetical protein